MVIVLVLIVLTAYFGIGLLVTRNQYQNKALEFAASSKASKEELSLLRHASYCNISYRFLDLGCDCFKRRRWHRLSKGMPVVNYHLVASWPLFCVNQFITAPSKTVRQEKPVELPAAPDSQFVTPSTSAISNDDLSILFKQSWGNIERMLERDKENAQSRGYEYLADGSVRMLDSTKKKPVPERSWRKDVHDLNQRLKRLAEKDKDY